MKKYFDEEGDVCKAFYKEGLDVPEGADPAEWMEGRLDDAFEEINLFI